MLADGLTPETMTPGLTFTVNRLYENGRKALLGVLVTDDGTCYRELEGRWETWFPTAEWKLFSETQIDPIRGRLLGAVAELLSPLGGSN